MSQNGLQTVMNEEESLVNVKQYNLFFLLFIKIAVNEILFK